MPANATSQRSPIALSFADSSRRAQNSPEQGEAFRSALDSIERGANQDAMSPNHDRGLRRNESLQESRSDERRAQRSMRSDAAVEARREERATERRADAKKARHKADNAARRDEQSASRREETKRSSRNAERREQKSSSRAHGNKDQEREAAAEQAGASANKDHEIAEASRGGFGSDPPVLEFAKAGGSDRVAESFSAASAAVADDDARVVDHTKSAARSGKGAANPPLQSVVLGAAEFLSGAAAKTSSTAGVPASNSSAHSEAASAGALAASAALDAESMGDEPKVLSLDPLSEDATPMAAKLERAMSKVAVEPTARATSSGDSSNAPTQASAGQSSGPASRGLASSANGAGLDGSQQPSPTLDPFNEPEPLPGSVRLRGLRGARINVPTGDGEVISARLNVNEEQVDIRLSAPEGSSQLAEQRASELRQALSSHGMELGEFDVSTSNGQSAETASGENSGDSSSDEGNSTSGDGAVDPWGRPVGTETQRGSAVDGRGALLDLRL